MCWKYFTTFVFISIFICGFSQESNTFLSKKEFKKNSPSNLLSDTILSGKIDSIWYENKILRVLINEELKNIHDSIRYITNQINEKHLQQTFEDANTTIRSQIALIDIYLKGLNWVLIIIALLTLIFGVVAIRESARAHKATDRLNDRIDYFDDKVDKKLIKWFNVHSAETEKSNTDEIFKNLESNLVLQRKIAFEKVTTIESSKLKNYIHWIFRMLNSETITNEEKAILVEVLIQIDNDERD